MKQYFINGALTLMLAFGLTTNASAGLLGIYAGVGIGQSEITDLNPTDDDTGTKIYAGYRILGPLAIEVASVDMGKFYSDAISIDGISLDAVGYVPLGVVNVFAKAGLFSWKADYSGTLEETGTSAKYGIGIEYNLFTAVDLRVEYETYTDVMDTTTTSDITLISAGVNISF